MSDAREIPKKGQVWTHWKGTEYWIAGFARSTEDERMLVLYIKFGEGLHGNMWARDLDEFMGAAPTDEYRFTLGNHPTPAAST